MLDQTAHNPVPTVYAAIELSKKSWVIAIVQPAKGQPSIYRIKGGAFSDLVMRLRTATPVANASSYVTKRVTTVSGWHVHCRRRRSTAGFSIRPVCRSIAGHVV